MRAVILDFETTGVDAKTCLPIEVGAILVDNEWKTLGSISMPIYDESYGEIPEIIEQLTGHSTQSLKAHHMSPINALLLLTNMFFPADGKVDFAIAYNMEYDSEVYKQLAIRCGMDKDPRVMHVMNNVKWLCAMKDVEDNYKHKCWKLSHLALDHGLVVDPTDLHTAIADCELTRRMLEHLKTTMDSLKYFNDIPWVYLEALVKKPWTDNGVSASIAKALGFSWEKAKGDNVIFPKKWVVRVKQHTAEKLISNTEIEVRKII